MRAKENPSITTLKGMRVRKKKSAFSSVQYTSIEFRISPQPKSRREVGGDVGGGLCVCVTVSSTYVFFSRSVSCEWVGEGNTVSGERAGTRKPCEQQRSKGGSTKLGEETRREVR
eukprot:RCo004920